MPRYEVEVNGALYEVESDRELAAPDVARMVRGGQAAADEPAARVATGAFTPLSMAPKMPQVAPESVDRFLTEALGAPSVNQSFGRAMVEPPEAGMFNPLIKTVQGTTQGVAAGVAAAGRLPAYSPVAASRRELSVHNVVEDTSDLVHGALAALPPVMGFTFAGQTAAELQQPAMPQAGQIIGRGMSAVLDLPAHTLAFVAGGRPDPSRYDNPQDQADAATAARMWDANALLVTLGMFGKGEQLKAEWQQQRGIPTPEGRLAAPVKFGPSALPADFELPRSSRFQVYPGGTVEALDGSVPMGERPPLTLASPVRPAGPRLALPAGRTDAKPPARLVDVSPRLASEAGVRVLHDLKNVALELVEQAGLITAEKRAELQTMGQSIVEMFEAGTIDEAGARQMIGQLRAELNSVVKAKLAADGPAWTARTAEDVNVSGTWRVVDLGELQTATRLGETQNRDRTRAASREQIETIAQKLNPGELLESATADTGAPIVDAQGQVLAGNGRVMALQRVYDVYGENAAAYREAITAQAAKLGLDTAKMDGMQRPVLVRTVHDLGGLSVEDFVRQSNKPRVAQLSKAEQAVNDAALVRGNDAINAGLVVDENGGVQLTQRALRAFADVVRDPSLLNKDGSVNVGEATTRLRRAIVQAVLPDADIGLLMAESGDGWVRISNALMASSPKLIKLQGTPYDLAPELAAGLKELNAYRNSGMKLMDWLQQQQMDLGDRPHNINKAVADLMFLLMEEGGRRSGAKITAALDDYARLAQNVGETSTGDMFGGPPSKVELAKRAFHATRESTTQLDLTTGKPAPVVESATSSTGNSPQARLARGPDSGPVGTKVPATPPVEPPVANTLFTKDAADAAWRRIQERGGRATALVDPTVLVDVVQIGGYHLERLARQGVRSFDRWAREVVAAHGDQVKPYLRDAWRQLTAKKEVKDLLAEHRFAQRMDESDVVDIAAKARLTDRTYRPIKDAARREEVATLLDGLDLEQATRLALDANLDLPADKRQWIRGTVAERLNIETRRLREAGLMEEMNRAAQREADVKTAMEKEAEQLGRGLRATGRATDWWRSDMSPDGWLKYAEERLRKRLSDATRKLTPEQAAEVERLAGEIENAPRGFQRDEKLAAMYHYLDRASGVVWSDLVTDIFYAHIFSGFGTHAVNIVDTGGNVAGNLTAMMAAQPQLAPHALAALARGYARGLADAADAWQLGVISGTRVTKMETPTALELHRFRGGRLNPWNYAKYVRRGLNAADMASFRAAEEMSATQQAYSQARREGVRGRRNIRARVNEILAQTAPQRSAYRQQAANEGLTGRRLNRRVYELAEQHRPASLVEKAADYGRETTYNNQPMGVLGAVSDALARALTLIPGMRVVMPVVRIPMNWMNRGLDWTPWGYKRAVLGQGNLLLSKSGREQFGVPRAEFGSPASNAQLFKATAGTLGVAAVLGLAWQYKDEENPEFMVFGRGPANPTKNQQWRRMGGKPYSVKIGDRYVGYMYTPFGLGLAAIGAVMDNARFNGNRDENDLGNKAAVALQEALSAVGQQSFLQSLDGFLRNLGTPSHSAEHNWATKSAQTASGVLVPRLVQDIERVFYPEQVRAAGPWQGFASNLPVARLATNPVRTDALGQPMAFDRVPVLYRFTSATTDDPVWRTLNARQLFVGEPAHGIEVNDERLTNAQYHQYRTLAGQKHYAKLQAQLNAVAQLPRDDAAKLVRQLGNEARQEARQELGFDTKPARLSRGLGGLGGLRGFRR
jgi:hypothetical protein